MKFNKTYIRIPFYLAAVCAAGTLAYAGWIYNPAAGDDTTLSCAQMEMQFGMFDTALEKSGAVLQHDPDNLFALLINAHCRNAKNDFDGAFECYKKALGLCDHQREMEAEIRVALALEYSRRGNSSAALKCLQDEFAPEVSAGYVKFFYVRGVVREAAGDLAGALGDYQNAGVETAGADASLQLSAASRLAACGKADSALVIYEQLEKTSNPNAYYESAKLKFERGQDDNAVKELRMLPVNSRKSLSKVMAADADFWETIRQRYNSQRGVLPEDIQELIFVKNR
ncbi:MAG: hypothetical protein HY286_10590 [Planctomycetes bacterium]|nr:hypothetical protein [Planctomycetota bacterium]